MKDKLIMVEVGAVVLRMYLFGLSVEEMAEILALKKVLIKELLNVELKEKCEEESVDKIQQFWRNGAEHDLSLEIPVGELCMAMEFTGAVKSTILRYCKQESIRIISIRQLIDLVYTVDNNTDYWRGEIHRLKGVGRIVYTKVIAAMTLAPLGENYQMEWGIRLRMYLLNISDDEQERLKKYLEEG